MLKKILANLISLAPLAIESIIKVIDTGYDLTLEDALHLEAVHFGILCATHDKHEVQMLFYKNVLQYLKVSNNRSY